MKVTALLPDPLVGRVKKYARGKNLTDCLVIALNEWLAQKKLLALNKAVQEHFKKGFSASRVRALNRPRLLLRPGSSERLSGH